MDEKVNDDREVARADEGVRAGSEDSDAVDEDVEERSDREREDKFGEKDDREVKAAADDGLLLSALEAGEGEIEVEVETKDEKAEEADTLMEMACCCLPRNGEGCLTAAAFTLLPPCLRLMVACTSFDPSSALCCLSCASVGGPSRDCGRLRRLRDAL